MSEVIDGVPQPFLRAQGVHLEAQEEKQQTNGGLELVRIPPFFVPQLLDELVTAWVQNVVSSHPGIGACQGHRHAVYAPVSDENEERSSGITLPNRNV